MMLLYYTDEMLIDYIAGFFNIEKGSVRYEEIRKYVKENTFGI